MHPTHRLLLFLVLTVIATGSRASQGEVDRILALPKAPEGVVFEIVSSQDHALTWAIPQVQRHVERLRARFPTLAIAVVSHGREQFALTEANHARYATVHTGVREIRQQGVDVQVCGTHASWRQLEPEDFPDYVDVVSAAPSAIQKYREFGYRLVVLRAPPERRH